MNHVHNHDRANYYPLFLIMSYLILVTLITSYQGGHMSWHRWMNQFMAGFFLVFSAFKFLDLKGFAQGYATYDLLARKVPVYGTIYPWLELALGLLYLFEVFPLAQMATVIIMGFSSLGVMNSLLKKQNIRCVCLGTVLNIPLSTITLLEDLLMVFLALIGLLQP